MSKIYALYNPLAGQETFKKEDIASNMINEEIIFLDITSLDYPAFCAGLNSDDQIIICGGDGTLNRFVNDIYRFPVKNNIRYYAMGRENTFIQDIGKHPKAVPTFLINKYLRDLPTVTRDGVKRKFLNGIGFGLDAFVCKLAKDCTDMGKAVDYRALARKAVFQYKPGKMVITIDRKV